MKQGNGCSIRCGREKYVMDRELTINQVAYKLGSQYPQHFTRLFKKEVGMTPSEYRIS